LLAHSWAAFSSSAPLEIIVVGNAPALLTAQLRDLGVELVTSPPHPLNQITPSANKLLGLQHPSDVPVLLVDNDICFLEDVSSLEGRRVAASTASKAAKTDAQWEQIKQATGLQPLTVEWLPLEERVRAAATGRSPAPATRLHLHAGVVWVRQPVEFEAIWAAHIDAIAPWKRGYVQPGLATAVAAVGGFDVLPHAYNYLPICFRLGVDKQPKILHLMKLGARGQTLTEAFTEWWNMKMARYARTNELLEQAVRIQDRVLRLCADADLDTFVF
jgi:hypothetical protein